MAYIPVPNVVATELRYTIAAQNAENTLSFLISTTPTASIVQWTAEFVGEWWYTYLRQYQRNGLELREVYARDLTSESGPAYSDTTYSGVTGAATTGTILPNNVTYAISFRTAGRGRSYRGRNYLVALSTSWVTASEIQATFRDNVIAAYNRLLPGGGSAPPWATWCIASKYHNNAPRTPTGIAIPIVAVTTTDNHTDSARRRLPGRGL